MVYLPHNKTLDIVDGGRGGQVYGPSVQSPRLQKECSGLKPWLGSTMCVGARHFALLVTVCTQVHKLRVPVNLMLGVGINLHPGGAEIL